MPIYKILQNKLQPKEAEDAIHSVRRVKKGPRRRKSKGDQPLTCVPNNSSHKNSEKKIQSNQPKSPEDTSLEVTSKKLSPRGSFKNHKYKRRYRYLSVKWDIKTQVQHKWQKKHLSVQKCIKSVSI